MLVHDTSVVTPQNWRKGRALGGARRVQTTADLGGAVSGARASGRTNELAEAAGDADATSGSRIFWVPRTTAIPGVAQTIEQSAAPTVEPQHPSMTSATALSHGVPVVPGCATAGKPDERVRRSKMRMARRMCVAGYQ